MGDLISKHDVLNAPLKLVHDGIKWIPVYYVEELPYIKRRTGKWTRHPIYEGSDHYYYACSECDYRSWKTDNYCSVCGAKMEGEME